MDIGIWVLVDKWWLSSMFPYNRTGTPGYGRMDLMLTGFDHVASYMKNNVGPWLVYCDTYKFSKAKFISM